MDNAVDDAQDRLRVFVRTVKLEDLAAKLQTRGSLNLTLKVIPRSSRNELVGVLEDGTLRLKVTAAPEKGKANLSVCELLAEAFGVPKRNVQILQDQTSTTKQVSIRR